MIRQTSVLAKTKPAATGKAKASLIGLTTRKDGTEQVTSG